MCGIAGIADTKRPGPADQALVHRMCDAMVHRGPDAEGFHFTDSVALGMRRLSIIDLTTGDQPVFNEDRTIAVVFNGEIYNYKELVQELVAAGHHFNTHSDTETLVHAYEEYGDDFVTRLRGMFCFALWDGNRRRLLLARDRLGIKQLYYRQHNGRLLFGSEMKCLLQDPEFSPRVDATSLAKYLTFLYVPGPATMLAGVEQLEPAHLLVWQEGRISKHRYWQLRHAPDATRSADDYAEEMLSKLTEAVRLHLRADVPLGVFLSGGIDSGMLVALASQLLPNAVETFTVGFEGDYGLYDERADARLVAQRYHTHHHEQTVEPQLEQVIRKIAFALDQPVADSSVVPSFYVCEMARRKVKVALSGLGGDELAGGYERYLAMQLGQHYRRIPRALRRVLAGTFSLLPDWNTTQRFSTTRIKRLLASAGEAPHAAYLRMITAFDLPARQRLLRPEWAAANGFEPEAQMNGIFAASGADSPAGQAMFADATLYLPDDLLPVADRMSMIHSLELRVPFLDHELLELSARMPTELKIHGMQKKYLLRRLAAQLLPPEIVQGKKRGFSIPLAVWIRQQLRGFIEERLSPRALDAMGYFEPAAVARVLREHMDGRANHENAIWALAFFSLWHEVHLERPGRPQPLAETPSSTRA